MIEEQDVVSTYGRALGFDVRVRTILVEGTTDFDLFSMAAALERDASGTNLLEDLAIVSAGQGDAGGTPGVIRELLAFRGIARTVLRSDGSPKYRFVALFDNDRAGKYAVQTIQALDHSIVEYKDVFRLRPVMPMSTNLDPTSLAALLDAHNKDYRTLDWELEDLLAKDLVEAFLRERPNAVVRHAESAGRVHREFSREGKAQIHRFVKDHGMHPDLADIINVLKSLRSYLGLK